MAATGAIKFDGLAVVSFEGDVLKRELKCRAAFVDTATGHTHGWTESGGATWGEDTKQALNVLIESMERDLGRLHFSSTPTVGERTQAPQDPGGLGEHIKDAPSV